MYSIICQRERYFIIDQWPSYIGPLGTNYFRSFLVFSKLLHKIFAMYLPNGLTKLITTGCLMCQVSYGTDSLVLCIYFPAQCTFQLGFLANIKEKFPQDQMCLLKIQLLQLVWKNSVLQKWSDGWNCCEKIGDVIIWNTHTMFSSDTWFKLHFFFSGKKHYVW